MLHQLEYIIVYFRIFADATQVITDDRQIVLSRVYLFDPAYPFARLTKSVGGSSTTYFADYYYQAAGLRVLSVGGTVNYGRIAGARFFFASYGPSGSYWYFGASLSPA